MTQGGRDIDSIWAKLKADTQPKPKPKALQHPPIPRYRNGEERASSSLGVGVVRRDDSGLEVEVSVEPLTLSEASPKADVPEFNNADEAANILQKSINSLNERVHTTRRRAIEHIASCLDACAYDHSLHTDVLVEVVAKPLLRRFEDPNEKCRELAIATLTHNLGIAKEDGVECLLPYVMPVLGERIRLTGGSELREIMVIGSDLINLSHTNRIDTYDFARLTAAKGSPAERAEEVRLHLVRLVRVIVTHGSHALMPYAQDCCEFILTLTHDPYHEVAIAAVASLREFAEAMNRRIWTVSKILLAAIAPRLGHRRQAVRVATVEALTPLIFNGGHEAILDLCSFRDPNVVAVRAFYGDDTKVNYFGKLITDACPKVRLTFVRAVGTWLLELPERRDHEGRLLPYLMSGLIDEDARVQACALETLTKLGELFIVDHAEDMKDKLYYLPDAAHAHGWMDGKVWEAIAEGAVPPPAPFDKRPSLGVRLLVQGTFKGVLNALCDELSSWQEQPRFKAARLLRIFLLCIEDHVATNLEQLLSALCHAHVAEDASIRGAVVAATEILSYFVDPALSIAVLRKRMSPSYDARIRQASLALLTAVVVGATRVSVIGPYLAGLAGLLEEEGIVETRDTALRMAAVRYCDAVRVASGPCPRIDIAAPLLGILLLVGSDALGEAPAPGAAEADRAIAALALDPPGGPSPLPGVVGARESKGEGVGEAGDALGKALENLCDPAAFAEHAAPELVVAAVCKGAGLLASRSEGGEGEGGEGGGAAAVRVLTLLAASCEEGEGPIHPIAAEAAVGCLAIVTATFPNATKTFPALERAAWASAGEGGGDARGRAAALGLLAALAPLPPSSPPLPPPPEEEAEEGGNEGGREAEAGAGVWVWGGHADHVEAITAGLADGAPGVMAASLALLNAALPPPLPLHPQGREGEGREGEGREGEGREGEGRGRWVWRNAEDACAILGLVADRGLPHPREDVRHAALRVLTTAAARGKEGEGHGRAGLAAAVPGVMEAARAAEGGGGIDGAMRAGLEALLAAMTDGS